MRSWNVLLPNGMVMMLGVMMIMVKMMMMMMNATNRWRESLPSKNNQKQPIGSDRLQFTEMRIIMMIS